MSLEYLSFSLNLVIALLLLYVRSEVKRLDDKLCYFIRKLEQLEKRVLYESKSC